MVERFDAEVWVTRGAETVGGASIMGLMMLSRRARHIHHRLRRWPGGTSRHRRNYRTRRQQIQRRIDLIA